MYKYLVASLSVSLHIFANLYITGNQTNLTTSNGVLWLVDSKGNLLNTSLLPKNIGDSLAYVSISVGNRVVISGVANNKATIWIADAKGNILKTAPLSATEDESNALS